jgi:hypothetical protein
MMRTIFALVLLLAASATAARAQDAPWKPLAPRMEAARPDFSALDAAADGRAWRADSSAVVRVREPRDRRQGALVGSVAGAVAGILVARLVVCGGDGEAGSQEICTLAGLGFGALAGAAVGAIIGAPQRP